MKKLVALFIFPLLFACTQEPGYQIKGDLEGLGDSYVYLKKEQDREWVKVDSVKAESGEFVLEGTLKAPEMFVLTFGEQKSMNLFVENSDIQITGHIDSLNDIQIAGSQVQNDYETYKNKISQYDKELSKLYDNYQSERKAGNEEAMKNVEEEYMAVSDNRQEFIKQFVKDRTESVISPYVASKQLMPYMDYQELDSLYTSLGTMVKESKYAQDIKERRDLLERVQVGKPYIDFSLPDTAGNTLQFSDYVGDGYVLLDFWAAWCNPCRKENPHLVKNYKKYKDEGFEIVGVSLDRKKEAWVKAIHKDNITWPQASDLKGWDNPTRMKYGVMAIPANFLINEEGTIVAKNLRGQELEDKLKEIYEKE